MFVKINLKTLKYGLKRYKFPDVLRIDRQTEN